MEEKTHLLQIYHTSYGPPSLEPCCLATAAPSRCLWLGAVAGRRGAAASAAALASSTAARWAAVARRCARLARKGRSDLSSWHQVWWNVDTVNSTHLQFKGLTILSVEPRNLYESASYSTHLPNSFPPPSAPSLGRHICFFLQLPMTCQSQLLDLSPFQLGSLGFLSCFLVLHSQPIEGSWHVMGWKHRGPTQIGWCFRLEGWGLIGLMLLKSQLLHQLLSL